MQNMQNMQAYNMQNMQNKYLSIFFKNMEYKTNTPTVSQIPDPVGMYLGSRRGVRIIIECSIFFKF
jgi:hypothetical protein